MDSLLSMSIKTIFNLTSDRGFASNVFSSSFWDFIRETATIFDFADSFKVITVTVFRKIFSSENILTYFFYINTASISYYVDERIVGVLTLLKISNTINYNLFI